MINALIGGALIGLAVSLMLLFNGRITGISGILGSLYKPEANQVSWRVLFIAGLLAGGFLLRLIRPEAFIQESQAQIFDYVLAGLLVGFGSLLGSGCTSGHGVCGLSRFSARSLFATLTFMSFGILSVVLFRLLRGEL
jgi:uncharacterized protein